MVKIMWATKGSAIVEGDRFLINNIVTGNPVESHRTAEEAMLACKFLNNWAVGRCKSTARNVVIDLTTTSKYYTDLEYKNLYH